MKSINYPSTGFAVWILVFLLIRCSIIVALYLFTGGNEVASDVSYHRMLLDRPFAIINGTAQHAVASYAPLQSFLTWPIYNIYIAVFPDFIAIRLLMVTFELLGFILLFMILNRMTTNSEVGATIPKYLFFLIVVFAPHQFLASTVFVQDEIICSLFLLLCLWFKLNKQHLLALFSLAAGVLFGKIFMIIPLFYLTVFGKTQNIKQRLSFLLPTCLIACVYATVVLMAQSNNGNIPFVNFNPDAEYSVGYWTLLFGKIEDVEFLKNQSLLLSIALQSLLSIWLIYYCFLKKQFAPSIQLATVPLVLFFLAFYQHNAEYAMIVAASLMLGMTTIRSLFLVMSVFSFAWVPKFFFGLKNIGLNNATSSDTRNRLLSSFVERVGIDFKDLHTVSIIIYSCLFLLTATYLVSTLMRKNDGLVNRNF